MSQVGAARQQVLNRLSGGTPGAITHVAGGTATAVNGAGGLSPSLGSYAEDDVNFVFAVSDNDTGITHTGPSGYTLIFDDAIPAPNRARRVSAWYKILTASESAPTVGASGPEARVVTSNLFRGLDTVSPFDVVYVRASHRDVGTAMDNPTARSIITSSDGAAILILQSLTENQVTAVGAPASPSGMLVGTSFVADHRNAYAVYLLDAGAAGTKNFSAMTNANGSMIGSYGIYTLALKAATV